MDVQVLYIGYALPAGELGQWLGPSVAGNKMECGIISGLHREFGAGLRVLTIVPIAHYPREKKIYLQQRRFQIDEEIVATAIPLINMPIIKQLSVIWSLRRAIADWLRGAQDARRVIITYNAAGMISIPLRLATRRRAVTKVCLLADPPLDLYNERGLKGLLKRFDNHLFARGLHKYDAVVAVNEEAAKDYAPGKPYLIVNGGYAPDDTADGQGAPDGIPLPPGTVKLLFAGALTDYNGIGLALTVMERLSDNYRLYLFGDGPWRERVKKRAREDPRLIYGGTVPNSSIRALQTRMDVLLNLRMTADPISRYSFPSKILEYMASATPVISTRVNALADGYERYLYFLEEETPQALRELIEAVVACKGKARAKALAAREFVLRHMTWEAQSAKIADFIRGLFMEKTVWPNQ